MYSDPFQFIHECLHELVLQHFNADDVKIFSEVDKNWHDVIGRSRKCMKQINLGLTIWWKKEDMLRNIKIIEKTTRKYQNIRIYCANDEQLNEGFLRLLKSLAPTLIDVTLLDFEYVSLQESIQLPKLERLELTSYDPKIEKILLHDVPHLKKLSLKRRGMDRSTSSWIYNKEDDENFLKFLESSKHSLEAIKFMDLCINENFVNKIFQMPAIKTIYLNIRMIEVTALDLSSNPNITELQVPYTVFTLDLLMPFLNAAPNVKVLYVMIIYEEILKFLANNMRALEIIYFSSSGERESHLKKIISESNNCNIQLILKKSFYEDFPSL